MKKLLKRAIPAVVRTQVAQVRQNARIQRLQNVVMPRLSSEESPDFGHVQGSIVFWTPEAGVEPHFAAQCMVARTLQELGHCAIFVRCFRNYDRCPVMDMHGSPYDASDATKLELCLGCGQSSMRTLHAYALPHFDLKTLLTPQMHTEIDTALSGAPTDLREFYFRGVAFGKLCAMDLVLATKISDFETVDSEKRFAWLQYLENSMRSYLMAERLCREAAPDVMVHFNDYSLQLGARLAFEAANIRCVGVTLASHKNIDRQRYILRPKVFGCLAREHSRQWHVWRELCLTQFQVRTCGDDFLVRCGGHGSHQFSPAKTFGDGDVRERLGLDSECKLLVAYTSSLDEMVAAQMQMAGLGEYLEPPSQPFADQIEWLHALIDFVAQRHDLQLVVRIHPREGTRRRAGVSQHLERLRHEFAQLPRRCHFIWPDDDVSSYDLAEAADVALISWSALGVELGRLGVPTLASTNGINAFPQDDFLEWGATPQKYIAALDSLLTRETSLETIAHAYRWYQLHHLASSLDLSDVVPPEGAPPAPRDGFTLPIESRAIEEIVIEGRSVLDINLERQRAEQSPASAALEKETLIEELQRVVHFFHTGETVAPTAKFIFMRCATDPAESFKTVAAPQPDQVLLLTDGFRTLYYWRGRQFERYSPLCARLARLCGSAKEPGV